MLLDPLVMFIIYYSVACFWMVCCNLQVAESCEILDRSMYVSLSGSERFSGGLARYEFRDDLVRIMLSKYLVRMRGMVSLNG